MKQEQLLKSKIKIVADRNQRFAAIIKELEELKSNIKQSLNEFERNITGSEPY